METGVYDDQLRKRELRYPSNADLVNSNLPGLPGMGLIRRLFTNEYTPCAVVRR
jgi:hypothetical protein